jgi:hypothetical protein
MPLSDRPWGPVTGGASVATAVPINTQATPTGPLPATATLTSNAETLILAAFGAALPLTCQVHPDTAIEQGVFDLWGSGIITTGTTTNLTLKVYEGSAIASGNLLGSSGAIAQNGTTSARVTAAWWAHARLIYDSVSGTLAGDIEFYVNKTKVASVTLSNFVTGFVNAGNPAGNPATASVTPEFCLSVTSSGATTATNAETFVNVQKFSCG